jgi:hypothetical protein
MHKKAQLSTKAEYALLHLKDDLGRTLGQFPDQAKRDQGEQLLCEFYAGHNFHQYQPYPDLEAASTYTLSSSLPTNAQKIYVHSDLIGGVMFQEQTAIAQSQLNALEVLDDCLFAQPLLLTYKPLYVRDEVLPELGAYIGNYLVKHQNAAWQLAEPLLRSRLQRGAVEFNPFLVAFKAIYFYYPLRYLIDGLPSSDSPSTI